MPREDRRDRERERDDRRPKDYGNAPKRPAMNEYFVEGDGIDRQVLQSELCKFLGTDATCKPWEHNGIKGYKIKAMRPFTSEMLLDLKKLSENYVMENRRHPGDLSYDDSDTFRQWNHSGLPPPGSGGSGYPSQMPGPYGSDMASGFPQGGYPGGQGYPAFPSMPPNMGGIPATSMPEPFGDPRYTMGQPPRDYQQGNYYPQGQGYGDNVPRASRDQPMPPFYGNVQGQQDPSRGYGPGYGGDTAMRGVTGTSSNPYDMPRPPNGSPYGEPARNDPNMQYRPQGQDPYAHRGGRRP